MIELPYPATVLSPNSRSHWGARIKPTDKHRAWARNATLAAKPVIPANGTIHLLLTAYPATKRNRDRDNLLSSCKAYLDGIADALKVNDSRFDVRVQWGEVEKPGKIVVTIFDPFDAAHLAKAANGPLMDANRIFLPAGKCSAEEVRARSLA